VSFLLSILARHWKSALVVILLSGAGLYGWWQHHEAAKYHDRLVTLQQAERDATAQAKAEQARADAKSIAQARKLARQAKSSSNKASQIAVAARSAETATKGRLMKITSQGASQWLKAPIPASIRKALGGGS